MKIVLNPAGAVAVALSLCVLGYFSLRKPAPPVRTSGNPSSPSPSSALLTAVVASAMLPGAEIYSDALQNGWQDWSWSQTHDMRSAAVTANKSAFAIRAIAKANDGVYFRHEPFTTRVYDRIALSLNGGDEGGQVLSLAALKGGAVTGNSEVYGVVLLPPLPRKRWTIVVVPLARLGVDNKPDGGGFWMQRRGGAKASTFYVDNVRLLSSGDPAPAPLTTVTDDGQTENVIKK